MRMKKEDLWIYTKIFFFALGAFMVYQLRWGGMFNR